MGKKMKRCKVCGAEIATSAKPCPSCGAKNKKLIVLGVILLILSILLFAQAFSGSGEAAPNKVTDATDMNQNPTESVAPAQTESGVMESAELNDTSNSSNGGIVLGPGTYVVGEDIDAGKYDCVAISGFGVLRGEVASAGPAGFVQTMGDSTVTIGGETAGVQGSTSYSNLTLANGDVIYIEMSLNVEFVKK